MVRTGPDKVTGVDLESKGGQNRAIRDQKRTNIEKIITQKMAKRSMEKIASGTIVAAFYSEVGISIL